MGVTRSMFRATLGKRLPITDGALTVHGARDPVTIRRDRYGVPYVEAHTDHDAWYGVGFCLGQDRAFQVDSLARAARGRISEIAGPDTIAIDRLSRRIGFRHAAAEQAETLEDEIRDVMAGYCLGINEGARIGVRRRAHEFALLRAEPLEFDTLDILSIAKLMSFLLASNWDHELTRYKILTTDGSEALAAIDVAYDGTDPELVDRSSGAGAAARLGADMELFSQSLGGGGGSNNWALAGTRTASGRPIVANDPHLAASLPPHWYLAQVRTPDWSVAGAAFVGLPAIVAGHNEAGAWGVTAGLVDNTDLFIEEIGPDGASVRDGAGFTPCAVRHETIAVKGGEPIEEVVLDTPRGPLVGSALEGEVGAVSMRATWLDPVHFHGLFTLHKARSFEEFRTHLEPWPGLPLNFVWADTSGSIGWQLVGDAPIRRSGSGTVPQAGWSPDAGWEAETVPFAEMPHASDPASGYLATANNRPLVDEGGPFLGLDWMEGYRVDRILEALAERTDWDLDATASLQMDRLSLPWREMGAVVLGASVADEAARAQDLLRTWDGVVSAKSVPASIFETFVGEIAALLVQTKAPGAAEWGLGRGFTPLVPHSVVALLRTGQVSRLLRDQPPGWFDRPWNDVIGEALAAAVRSLEMSHGPDETEWQWGSVRPLTLAHPIGERRPFDQVFNIGPIPWGGDAATVAQAAVIHRDIATAPPYIQSMRMVVDVGNWENNRFVLPGGQSGNPLSRHYADMVPLWRYGKGVSIAWSEDAIRKVAVKTLELTP